MFVCFFYHVWTDWFHNALLIPSQDDKTKRWGFINDDDKENTSWLDDYIKCLGQQNLMFTTQEPEDDSVGITTAEQMDKAQNCWTYN